MPPTMDELQALGFTPRICDPAQLLPHPRNYNTHPPAQVAALGQSLAKWQQYKNIVVWQDYILCGHGFVQAALQAGLPVVANDCSHLSETDALALIAADNALPFGAEPDMAALQELLDGTGEVEIPGVSDEWLAALTAQVDAIDTRPMIDFAADADAPAGRLLAEAAPDAQTTFPLAILLTATQYAAWQTYKTANGLKEDATAFLRLLASQGA